MSRAKTDSQFGLTPEERHFTKHPLTKEEADRLVIERGVIV